MLCLVFASLTLAEAPRSGEMPHRADAARLMGELMSGKAQVGGPFVLTEQHGKKPRLADFRGHIVLLYFGYTYCPDVCPTDLAQIANLIKSLARMATTFKDRKSVV